MTPVPTLGSTALRPMPLPARRVWMPADSVGGEPSRFTQGALALSYPTSGTSGGSPRTTALVVVPHGARQGASGGMEAWAATFMQAVIEVIGSQRPLTQLVRWTSRQVYAEILRRQRRVARHRGATITRSGRPQVATVHVFRPDECCAEVAARVTAGQRSSAIAARLDYVRGRWMCTAITFDSP